MQSGHQERVERKLAAILAADVAGYSRLMGADEEGTLAALRAIRHEIADLKIKEHRGRIVKTTGDGLLVEFASVVDAIRGGLAKSRAPGVTEYRGRSGCVNGRCPHYGRSNTRTERRGCAPAASAGRPAYAVDGFSAACSARCSAKTLLATIIDSRMIGTPT